MAAFSFCDIYPKKKIILNKDTYVLPDKSLFFYTDRAFRADNQNNGDRVWA